MIDHLIRTIILVECGICLLPYLYLIWIRFKRGENRFMVRNMAASIAIINVIFGNIARWDLTFTHWYSYLPIVWVGLLGLALLMTKSEDIS